MYSSPVLAPEIHCKCVNGFATIEIGCSESALVTDDTLPVVTIFCQPIHGVPGGNAASVGETTRLRDITIMPALSARSRRARPCSVPRPFAERALKRNCRCVASQAQRWSPVATVARARGYRT